MYADGYWRLGVKRANEPISVHEFELFEQDDLPHKFDIIQCSVRRLQLLMLNKELSILVLNSSSIWNLCSAAKYEHLQYALSWCSCLLSTVLHKLPSLGNLYRPSSSSWFPNPPTKLSCFSVEIIILRDDILTVVSLSYFFLTIQANI